MQPGVTTKFLANGQLIVSANIKLEMSRISLRCTYSYSIQFKIEVCTMTTVCTPHLGYLYSFIFNTKSPTFCAFVKIEHTLAKYILHFVILEFAYLKSLEYFKDHLQYILVLKKSS